MSDDINFPLVEVNFEMKMSADSAEHWREAFSGGRRQITLDYPDPNDAAKIGEFFVKGQRIALDLSSAGVGEGPEAYTVLSVERGTVVLLQEGVGASLQQGA